MLLAGERAWGESNLTIPGNGISVPMLSFGGRPGLNVKINGQGPFPFVVDTGANRTVIDSSLAHELSLPSGGDETIIKQLQIGDANLRDVPVMAGPLLGMPGQGDSPRGVLSAVSLPGYLLTFDFPRRQITIREGALGEPNGKTIFSYDEREEFPTVPITVAGREFRVHLDTGAPIALALPTKYKDEMPLEGVVEEGHKVRTPGGEFAIYKGTPKGNIDIGAYKLPAHEIFFTDAVPSPGATPRGQLGCAALSDFAVTLDSRNRRIGFTKQSPTDASPARGGAEAGKAIQAYLDSLVVDNKLSGVALVAKDGTPIASKAGGYRDKESGALITLNTKFNIGSLNKMFTAVAVAQLVQAGQLSFDDTVGKCLPDYPNKEVAAKVTIDQLLTHTSGMGSYWNDKFASQRAKLHGVADYIPIFADDPLAFSPGEKFQYSNAGYMLLGVIIERISGADYYDYIQKHIFEPAGMTNSGFAEAGQKVDGLAVGYSRMDPEGHAKDGPPEKSESPDIRGGPAGGGYSSAGDLVKFHTALRTHKLLTQQFTDVVTTGKVDAPGPIGRYAYGFSDKVFAGKHLVSHNGGAPGIAANFEMYPELGYTSVILMNVDPPNMMPIIMQLRQLIPSKQ